MKLPYSLVPETLGNVKHKLRTDFPGIDTRQSTLSKSTLDDVSEDFLFLDCLKYKALGDVCVSCEFEFALSK
jgi:hypothetical protein